MKHRAKALMSDQQQRPWLFQRADGAVVTQLWKIAAMKREQLREGDKRALAVRRAMVQGL